MPKGKTKRTAARTWEQLYREAKNQFPFLTPFQRLKIISQWDTPHRPYLWGSSIPAWFNDDLLALQRERRSFRDMQPELRGGERWLAPWYPGTMRQGKRREPHRDRYFGKRGGTRYNVRNKRGVV